ncbi:unnamed protein product [Brachionus calyciflorus]|uniref:tRNA (guanine-N(7)-)-methyltransferase non-catalytic subunit n=1 Tax=Brachionus calyciflorus TaxID=104777 RepID=A0A814F674_9BILA|nr:unnamed protein product [Brachionus calyciflorus]
MLDIRTINSSTLLIINFDTIHLFNNLNNDVDLECFKYKHSIELTTATYLPKKNLIAFTDLNKKFHLLDTNNQVLTTKIFQKRAAKLLVNQEETTVILGDKTGDVYSLSLNDLENNEFKLIMGHLSMLTDMRLSSDEKFLLTSDRDEKIRISHYPNTYNIFGYLLAHKEFVMQFEFLNNSNLLSVSGDSKLILWDLKTLKPHQIIDVKSFLKEECQKELNGIDRFDFDVETNRVFIHLFKANFLIQFDLVQNELKFARQINFNETIDDFVRLSPNFYLMAILKNELDSKFLIKKISESGLDELSENELKFKTLLNRLNSDVALEKASDVKLEMEKNYQSYFKAIVNNMEDYYQRKQERIQSTSGKRKHTISKSESDLSEPKVVVQ